MSSSEIQAVEAGAEARPVDGSDRLVLLDALRGFALCGVFVSNVFLWFSGRVFVPRAEMQAAMATASLFDKATMIGFMVLISGKFITLFSFLFGLGFAVQMGRAEARGTSIAPLYARRLAVLLLIGLTHVSLLWYGDILATYALLGFGLLLFRDRADKTVLRWAVPLVLLWPIAGSLLLDLRQLLSSPEVAAAMAQEATARSGAIRGEVLQVLRQGSYLEVLRAHARFLFGDFLPPTVAILGSLFGRFLLGMIAGRRRYFHDAARHLPFFRRVLRWGLLAGVLAGVTLAAFAVLFMSKVLDTDKLPWFEYVILGVRQLSELGFAAVYGAGFVLLFQRARWQRVLSVFAPVGRMALSNYLSQSVIGVLLFYGYGLGLIGKVGPARCVALTLGIFCVQIVLSRLWLARFRFGPAEWVWRSLTYGKAQPMRLEAPAPVPSLPVA